MNSHEESRVERRLRTQEMLEHWLEERQRMLVLYCELAGLEPFTPDKPVDKQLKEFCQLMVDYTALGHFEIYDRIEKGEERRGRIREVANEVYPVITETTDQVLAFNDRYDETDHELSLDHLTEDLSRLGEILARRIEMEDRLVEVLR